LLTEGTSISARHTLFALGNRYHIEVADAGFWRIGHASSLVQKWHNVPPFQTEPHAFIERILEIVQRREIDVLLPVHDETQVICQFREALEKHVALLCPTADGIEQLGDKAKFAECLRALELPQPPTALFQSPTALVQSATMVEQILKTMGKMGFPCYLKLPVSTASQGVWRVQSPDELPSICQIILRGNSDQTELQIVIQAAVSGIESAAMGLFHQGQLVAFHSYEEWAKGKTGIPIARRSAVHDGVLEHLRQLGAHLAWNGPLSLAYFYDRERRCPCYFECNPRIGESVNGMLSGVNLCDAWVRLALGESLTPLKLPRIGVASYCGFLPLVSCTVDGGKRRDLMRLLLHRLLHKGYYQEGESELTRLREDWLSWIPPAVVTSLLLVYPSAGRWLVRETVRRYAQRRLDHSH
jgi:biotin carboxylase